MLKNKRILFAIMGWGLGHATRCIPLIQALLKDNQVLLASNGISSKLLRQEFPKLTCIDYPDYVVKYPRYKILLIPWILIQLPGIIMKLIQEYQLTQRVVEKENIDIIVSDSRYGIYQTEVPTFFMMHQLRFQLAGIFKYLEFLGEWFNLFMFKRYERLLFLMSVLLQTLPGN